MRHVCLGEEDAEKLGLEEKLQTFGESINGWKQLYQQEAKAMAVSDD